MCIVSIIIETNLEIKEEFNMNSKEKIINSTVTAFKESVIKSLNDIKAGNLTIPSDSDVSDIEDQLFADPFLGDLCASQPELATLHAYIIYWYIHNTDSLSQTELAKGDVIFSYFEKWFTDQSKVPFKTEFFFNYIFGNSSNSNDIYDCGENILDHTVQQFCSSFLRTYASKPYSYLEHYSNMSVNHIKDAICKDPQANYLSKFFPFLTCLLAYFVKWISNHDLQQPIILRDLIQNPFNKWLNKQPEVKSDVIKMQNLLVHWFRSFSL